jgi:hypothetical protein
MAACSQFIFTENLMSNHYPSNPILEEKIQAPKRKNGKEIRVGDSLEMIMEFLMIIPEDKELLEKNPALKDAYEHHQRVVREVFTDDRLKESFDTYHTIRRLVKDETEDG